MDEIIAKGSYHGEGCPIYEVHKILDQYLVLAEYWGNEHHCWLFDDEFTATRCFSLMCGDEKLMD